MPSPKLNALLATILLLAACGSDTGPAPVPPPPTDHTIGGSVGGLSGSGLVLQLNGGSSLAIAASGSFVFPGNLANGSTYAVAVQTQPTSPSQTCTVNNGSGTLAGANVSQIGVSCTTNSFTVGGTISGLAGSGLVLQINGVGNLAITANGNFTFSNPLPSGTSYSVTVAIPPGNPVQTCTLGNAMGTVTTAAITSVTANCVTPNATLQEIPVAVKNPQFIRSHYSSIVNVPGSPPAPVGSIFVAGSNGLARLGSNTIAMPFPQLNPLAMANIDGAGAPLSRIFVLSAYDDVRTFNPGLDTTGFIATTIDATLDSMQISRGDHLILLLDSSQTRPPFSGAARVYIIDLLDNSPYLASQFQLARNSDDSHTRCPCELATTPENFSYVFGHGVGDTLSAFYADKNLASEPDGDRFGSIVFPDGIGQIVANGNAAYVTDFQGRLHVVAALPGNTLGQHDLQLGNFLTNIVIKGTLIRDASNAAPYFYEFGGGPNHPAGTPSTIKVYNFGLGNPALVATVATTTNSVVKAEFGSREIFFWDNTDLKAMSRNTWQVRTLAGAPLEAAGSRLFFDEVTKIIYFPSNDRDVVFAMDTTTP